MTKLSTRFDRFCLFLSTWFVLFTTHSLAQAPGSTSHPRESPRKPNVVFVIADDLGWADVAFHGGNAPTPCLDALVSQSAELTQHSVAPVCSPTRAGFLTGRCWSRFAITTPTNTLGLPPQTMTLPKALRNCGYETCLIGKWHLGSLPEWGPNHFGFDHSYGSLAGGSVLGIIATKKDRTPTRGIATRS